MTELIHDIGAASKILLVLLVATLGLPASAHFMEDTDPNALLGATPEDIQKITSPLFQFAPFRADTRNHVPAIADPLGMGVDPALKLYSGKLFNSDLLGYFQSLRSDSHNDLELPEGSVMLRELLSNYVERFFGSNVRAADRSLTSLRKSGKRTWLGLPTTKETSPLTLAGFGTVGEFIRPMQRSWLECEGVERRMYVMKEVPMNLRNKLPPPPNLCYEI